MPLKIAALRKLSLAGIAACALAAVWAAPARSQPLQPFAPPGGFVLAEPGLGKGREVVLYGETSPRANWRIAQWGNPGDGTSPKLPPFMPDRDVPNGVQAAWKSAMADGGSSVVVRQLKDGSFAEILSQNGANLPCVREGAPNEYDLFIATQGKNARGLPSAMLAENTGKPLPDLAQLSALRVRGVFSVVHVGEPPTRLGCKVNQSQSLVSFVLADTTAKPPQTLFYQLGFDQHCLPKAPPWCQHFQPHYFNGGSGGNGGTSFGIDDHLPSYGLGLVTDTRPHTIDIDILPTLERWIRLGTTGEAPGTKRGQPLQLDTDLSHWRVSGMYFGQHIWGDVDLSTSWTGFVPVMTVR
jgi:hypothetical protein